MVGAARKMLVIIAALFLSAGHIACACASASAPVSLVGNTNAAVAESADPHAHHQAGADDNSKHSPAPSHPDCSHCNTVALASDGAAKTAALPMLQERMAAALMPSLVLAAEAANGIRARRLHWAAPPRHSPVDLKIRLRN